MGEHAERQRRPAGTTVGRRQTTGAPAASEPLLALQQSAGNRATVGAIRRMAISTKNLGGGPLTVETGGDFDTNHTAAGWSDAVAKSAKRAPSPPVNTIIKDVAEFKKQVAAADYDSDAVKLGNLKVRGLKVSNVDLWQIDTKNAKEDPTSFAAERPAAKKTVHLKTKLAKADGKEKSPGASTPSDDGPVFLVTGVFKVL